jgi:hypothetical protein
MQSLFYTDTQLAQIQDKLDEAKSSNGWMVVEESDRLIECGKLRFAVFRRIAYPLLGFVEARDAHLRVEFHPVILGGTMYYMSPQKGAGGLLYFMHFIERGRKPCDRWIANWIPTGWLRTEELALSQEQIVQRLEVDVGRGGMVIMRKPTGWP